MLKVRKVERRRAVASTILRADLPEKSRIRRAADLSTIALKPTRRYFVRIGHSADRHRRQLRHDLVERFGNLREIRQGHS